MGAEHVAVDGFEEGRSFLFRNGDAGLVDAPTFQPGDAVVSRGDEAIETGDDVKCHNWVPAIIRAGHR